MDKKLLREEIRTQKRLLMPERINLVSQAAAKEITSLADFLQAKTIYCYMAYNQEIRTEAIIEKAWTLSKTVAVPKLYGKEMRFIEITSFNELRKDRFGIPTPISDTPVACDEYGFMLVPGLAFDRNGNRIGYGGGFYDRYLAAHSHHKTAAICYSFQLLPHLETEDHDIPVQQIYVY